MSAGKRPAHQKFGSEDQWKHQRATSTSVGMMAETNATSRTVTVRRTRIDVAHKVILKAGHAVIYVCKISIAVSGCQRARVASRSRISTR